MWLTYSILGSIGLIFLNTLCRLVPFQPLSIVAFSIMSVFVTLAYWTAFQLSDHFLLTWFIQSAMVSIGAVIANHFLVGDPMSAINYMGILLIVSGSYLLRV